MSARVPFAERGGPVRGVLDLVTGCYPAFLFGGSLGDQLPVFHLHEVTREWLEPRLHYLAENGYRTVTTDEIARLVVNGIRPAERAVALTFDDAWASAYAVAYPLLKQYGMRAVLFAIPARIADAGDDSPFVTWAQLRELQSSGVFDVQSHTRTHTMMFCDAEIVDFVSPEFEREPLLNRPADADGLGTPLYTRRSRMSDARRFHPDERAADRCRAHVAAHGGAAFFTRPDWRADLRRVANGSGGAFEDDATREATIRAELADARAILSARLAAPVTHVAMPWGISGRAARAAAEETGHVLCFAEEPLRRRTVRAGDDRFHVMRLNGNFITCLPGRGRQWFFSTVR
ncbi:MAG TPA: polysaccharide deacetylase family protein [Vicinamibacterales bacterium]|nr:polysaccharide deacetylase family protein [Vicinamibacterales bacterium]